MPSPEVIDAAFDRNPTLPGVADPYPIYRRVRESDPVHWCAEAQLWAITRYADAQSILKDTRLSRQAYLDVLEARNGPSSITRMQRHEMVFMDNPRHGDLRRLIGEAINVHAEQALQPQIEQIVEILLTPLLKRGQFDIIGDFARTFPTQVASAWLGVPPQDREQVTEGIFPLVAGRGVARDPETTAKASRAADAMSAYFLDLIRQRRATPADDLITAMIKMQEPNPSLMSDEDMIGLVIAVFAAGHGPGIAMLANTLLALFQNPDQLAQLRAEPDLASSALEEGLRYDAPTQAPNPLAALEDIEIGGKTIRKGEVISVILAAANRDPAAFPDPERFNIRRSPNRHLSFSGGTHYCLGAMLARAEMSAALEALVRRFPGLTLAVPLEDLRWTPHDRFRTLAALPVSFDVDAIH